MKPFIDTAFWSDPDMEACRPDVKLAALWLITNPQTSLLGICTASPARFKFETGLEIESLDGAIKALPRAFSRIGSAVFIRNYMRHQFGVGAKLAKNNFFTGILALFASIKDEDLRKELISEYPELDEARRASNGLSKPEVRKGKEGEGKEEEGRKQQAAEVLAHLNATAKRDFRATETSMTFISARLDESGVDVAGCKLMIERQCRLWIGTEQAEFLRPATLFNKTKFSSYYDLRNEPLPKGAAESAPAKPYADPPGWADFLLGLPRPYQEHRYAPSFLRDDFAKANRAAPPA